MGSCVGGAAGWKAVGGAPQQLAYVDVGAYMFDWHWKMVYVD